jgi:hypothetical protein
MTLSLYVVNNNGFIGGRGDILEKFEPSSGCVSHIRPFPAGLN